MLKTWYDDGDGFWEVEALSYYVSRSEGIKRRLLEVAGRRGLANGMQHAIARHKVTPAEMFPLITRSLAGDNNPSAWAHGAVAAQIYANDAFTARLIELATDPAGTARAQAIYALALNRTDGSVNALKTLLDDANTSIKKTAADAIRTAYLYRGVAQGRPLLESDFDASYRRQP